ncbi:MAG TPA: hypothetical protein VGS58_01300 [Candidatus Sulfopaludibacter sp.]|nr:hypothetical protein [Candidatus Sulfopaludibacter sp.]
MTLHDAGQQALGRLYGLFQAQAATLAYVDVFCLLAVFSALMFFGSLPLKSNKPGGGTTVSMH